MEIVLKIIFSVKKYITAQCITAFISLRFSLLQMFWYLQSVGLFMSIIIRLIRFSEAAPGLGYDVDGGDGLAVGGQHPGLLLLRHHQVVAGGSLQLLHWALGLWGNLLATTIMLLQLYCERCKDYWRRIEKIIITIIIIVPSCQYLTSVPTAAAVFTRPPASYKCNTIIIIIYFYFRYYSRECESSDWSLVVDIFQIF